MSESKNQKRHKQIFYVGIAVFALGILLAVYGYNIPSPVETPTYQNADATYFFPFLNWLTIGGIALAVAVLVLAKKWGKKRE